jgi:DNA repair protein RadC
MEVLTLPIWKTGPPSGSPWRYSRTRCRILLDQDRAGHMGPLLHELTMQHRPKRDADGRAIRLGPAVTNAYQAARALARFLAFEATEVFGVLCLTAPRRVIGWHEVSRGSVDTVWAAPRDVFRTALLSNAAALILAHNHPSGEAQPSDADCRLTTRMLEVANLLGIAILDHIIIGDHEYASVRAAVPPAGTQASRPWDALVCTTGHWNFESFEGPERA